MSSLTSLVSAYGALRVGTGSVDDPDRRVLALQAALTDAGYRVGQDGDFGERTQMVVAQFQRQHGLQPDGVVGLATAAVLDQPHDVLVTTAQPLVTDHPVTKMATPHDDTASLVAFYGRPWQDSSLLVHVDVPFAMTYEGTPVHSIQFHHKCADALSEALHVIAARAEHDASILRHVSRFSGSYNYRPIRGSSRLSCHSFACALDFDAERLPLGVRKPASEMPQSVVDAFKSTGAYWGGDFIGRADPQHLQYAHE